MANSKTGGFKEFVTVVGCALLTATLAVSMCGVAGAYTGAGDGGAGGTGDVYAVGFTLDPTTATFYSGSSQRFIAIATVLNTTTGGTTAEDVSSNVTHIGL